jgi:hypothetical protein
MIEEEEAQEEIAEIDLVSDDCELGIVQKSVSRTPQLAATSALLDDTAALGVIDLTAHLAQSPNVGAARRLVAGALGEPSMSDAINIRVPTGNQRDHNTLCPSEQLDRTFCFSR